jgi:hypothetical protein
MTLLELLVAFLIFAGLMFTLVSISTITLDSWTRGETRKDTGDRAEAIFSLLEEDLRNLFVDRQLPYIGPEGNRNYLMGAHLTCELDKARRPVLKLVRGADRDVTRVRAPSASSRPHTADAYAELYEIMYMFKDGSGETTLYRGVQFFNRADPSRSFFTSKRIDPASFRPVDEGVLGVELQFWGQLTDRWRGDPAAKGQGPGQEALLVWDSSRGLVPEFPFYKKTRNPDDPDHMVPEMVRITLVLKSRAMEDRRVFLAEDLSDAGTTIRLTTAAPLPDPPAFVRIEDEWVEYTRKDFSTLGVKTRGARLTAKARHPARTEVMFGDEFTRVVYLPIRMEAVRK